MWILISNFHILYKVEFDYRSIWLLLQSQASPSKILCSIETQCHCNRLTTTTNVREVEKTEHLQSHVQLNPLPDPEATKTGTGFSYSMQESLMQKRKRKMIPLAKQPNPDSFLLVFRLQAEFTNTGFQAWQRFFGTCKKWKVST